MTLLLLTEHFTRSLVLSLVAPWTWPGRPRGDNKHVSNLQAIKEKLSEDLKSSRKESEIQTIQSQVQGLETRLKYSLTDRDTTNKKIDKLSKEMDRMRAELEKFAPDYQG